MEHREKCTAVIGVPGFGSMNIKDIQAKKDDDIIRYKPGSEKIFIPDRYKTATHQVDYDDEYRSVRAPEMQFGQAAAQWQLRPLALHQTNVVSEPMERMGTNERPQALIPSTNEDRNQPAIEGRQATGAELIEMNDQSKPVGGSSPPAVNEPVESAKPASNEHEAHESVNGNKRAKMMVTVDVERNERDVHIGISQATKELEKAKECAEAEKGEEGDGVPNHSTMYEEEMTEPKKTATTAMKCYINSSDKGRQTPIIKSLFIDDVKCLAINSILINYIY